MSLRAALHFFQNESFTIFYENCLKKTKTFKKTHFTDTMSIGQKLALFSQLLLHGLKLITTVCQQSLQSSFKVSADACDSSKVRAAVAALFPWRSQLHGWLSITTATNYKNSPWAPAPLLC